MALIFFKIYRYFIKKIEGKGIGQIPLVSQINKQLFTIIKPKEVEFYGKKIILDKYDQYHLALTDYEIPGNIKNSIKKGQTVIDVGASIGLYTIFFAKMVGNNGKVYAFEPEPKNFELLKKNVEINGFDNVILENKAVSNTSGVVKMEISNNIANHRITNDNSKTTFDVQSVSLDEYFKDKSNKIDFIKIDTEGYDGYVILGALNIIEKNSFLKLMVEFHIKFLRDAGYQPEDFIKLLKKLKMKIIDLNNGKAVDEFYAKNFDKVKYYSTNFFCEKLID